MKKNAYLCKIKKQIHFAMQYTKDSHIECLNDVKTFFHHVIFERKVNIHPDNDFIDYISKDTRKPSFSQSEAALYNRLLKESFSVCQDNGADIYEIGCEELFSALNVA